MTVKRPSAGPRIIRAVMQRIEAGGLDPGQRILPRDIAHQLGMSDIPVREAFHQLVGRGILTERHGEGFYAAALNSTALHTLYTAHGRVADQILRHWSADEPMRGRHKTPWKLFAALADRVGDDGLTGIQHYVSSRLAFARRHEEGHVPYEIVIRQMANALRDGDMPGARRASREFHHVCANRVPEIWRAIMDR